MDFGAGSPPKLKPPPPPVEIDESDELSKVASQRKRLEAMRKGRKSMVVQIGTDAGLSAASMSGLRIPE